MLKRQYSLATGLVLLIVLVLLNLPEQPAARIKLALGGLFLPLFGIAGSVQQLTQQIGNTLVPRGTNVLPICWVSCWTDPAMPKRGRNNPPRASLILAAGCSGRLSSTSTINNTRPVAKLYCRLSIF